MPPCTTGAAAGGAGTVKPPTGIDCGKPLPPSQFGAEVVPVPGQEWHEEQSNVPGAAENGLWSSTVKPAGGLRFRWQLLQRAVVPLIASGLLAEKLAWNDACAHSCPSMPATFDAPACRWQKLQSYSPTLRSE